MTLPQIDALAEAVAHEEGFYVTKQDAATRRIRFPTRPQRNANPGNIRRWRDAAGRDYPTSGGFVDFVAWARRKLGQQADQAAVTAAALSEGWRVLRVLLAAYAAGRYTGGKVPTIRQFVARYAPSSDGNAPERYAAAVAMRLGAAPDDLLA